MRNSVCAINSVRLIPMERRSASMQCRLAAWTFAAAMGLTAWSAMAADAQTPAATCRSRGIGADSECAVNGVTLHYVDWGGRRGFGHSAIPPSGRRRGSICMGVLARRALVMGVKHPLRRRDGHHDYSPTRRLALRPIAQLARTVAATASGAPSRAITALT